MRQDISQIRRWGYALLTASIPLFVMLALITLQGYRWDDYAPVMGDEIMYWHQAASWTRVGLDSGYYSIDSLTAKVAHYFCWGLGPVIFYGTFGGLFGWSLNSILIINVAFLFMGVVIFVLLARLDGWRCAWLALLLAVYPALLVYLPSSMIEPIHLGGALVVAGGLYRLHRGERDLWAIMLTGLTLFLLCFLKITWVPIFWPFFYYASSYRGWLRSADSTTAPKKHLWGAMILTGVLGVVIYLFYNATAAPYPYDIMNVLAEVRTDLSLAFWHYGDLVTENMIWLFYPLDLASTSVRAAVIGLLVWAIVQRRRARRTEDREAVLLILFISGVVLALAVLVYATQSHRGFRLFAPYLLLAIGLLLAWNRLRVVKVLVALFLLTLPMVLLSPDMQREQYFNPQRAGAIMAHQAELKALGVVYREGADPWCNAFAHSIRYLGDLQDQDRLLALEPGLGMTILWQKPEWPTPARYVMLDDVSYSLYPDTDALTPLMPVEEGMLYLNHATACPDTEDD